MENIQGFLLINLYAFLLICFISIVFFSKKRLNQFEDKTYGRFLVASIFISISGLILGFAVVPEYNVPQFFQICFNKIYLIALLFWINILTLYTLYVSKKDKKSFDKTIKIFHYLDIVNIVMAIILPMELIIQPSGAVPSGLALMYSYSVFSIEFVIQLICVFRNYKDLKNKKYIPLYILSTLGIAVMANQIINPEMNYLVNPLFIFIAVVMYHTIENPDIKMLSELYKNKELVEQTYEDKSNFLFELTQEVRDPLYNISNICNNMKQEEDIKKIKSDLNIVNNSIRQLDFIVNDVLNVSTLDVQKVKFVNNRYSLKSLYDDVVARIKVNVSDNIEFRTNIPNNVPYLYGDSIKLKQILYSLIMNSVKKTEKGFIEFSVNTIEKYDVCRVIFTIVDSGSGMSIDKINEVLSVTGEFDAGDIENLEKTEFNIKLCQKIVKALGGNLLIKSKVGKGTEVMLTIDQRIYSADNDNSILKQYENVVYNSKKVLVVCQDKNITNILKKKLNDNNIGHSVMLYGMDAVDKIKSGKKYDFIIVQDDMKEMSGYTTLKEMQKLDKFNIPVIVMLDNNKVNIKEHYLKDGFEDYILLDNFSEEVNRILNKY